MIDMLDDARALADIDGQLFQRAREEMSILDENQDRKLMTWVKSMRGISDYLRFAFLEQAEKIRKAIVCLRIEQGREKP